MVTIEWDDKKYSCFVPEIDEHHKILVRYIDELEESMTLNKGKEKLYEVLLGMHAYTKTHFKFEEEMMKKNNFPQTSEHKHEHNLCIKMINEFSEDFKKGNTEVTIETLKFLKLWLFKHIRGNDKKFGLFLKEKI